MSQTRQTTIATSGAPVAHSPNRTVTAFTWTAQLMLGLPIAGGGLAKIFGDAAMVEMFGDIGAGQWLRVVVGSLEVAGSVGIFIPRLRALAALGLLLLLLGATFTNVVVLDTTPWSALPFAALAALVLLVRRHELPLSPTSHRR